MSHNTKEETIMHTYIMSAGYSLRFRLAGYGKPKYILNINGKRIIDRIIEMLPNEKVDILFRQHIFFDFFREHSFHKRGVSYKLISSDTRNVVETSLRGIDEGEQDIIISYNDFILDWDKHSFEDFCKSGKYDCVVVIANKENCLTDGNTIFGTLVHKNGQVIELGKKQN